MNPFPLLIAEEIKDALASGQGVVALESTVISHGLPFPENIAAAHALMAAVREEGAVPALIAIVDGFLSVGIKGLAIERLADPSSEVRKVSRRDIAFCLAKKTMGATTVSATMMASHLAGIRVFATGGIGGVHRGAEQSLDISADLYELAKTPVAVVCAGAKSILDIPKTLELLESYGVPILGYRTDYFPEFYCIGDEHKLHMRCESAEALAEVLRLHLSIGHSGAVVAQPIDDRHAFSKTIIEKIIIEAERAAMLAKTRGGELTPFLLREIARRSEGKSIESNCALLINNARLAAVVSRLLALK